VKLAVLHWNSTNLTALESAWFRPTLVESWTEMFLKQALAGQLWQFSCILLHLTYRRSSKVP